MDSARKRLGIDMDFFDPHDPPEDDELYEIWEELYIARLKLELLISTRFTAILRTEPEPSGKFIVGFYDFTLSGPQFRVLMFNKEDIRNMHSIKNWDAIDYEKEMDTHTPFNTYSEEQLDRFLKCRDRLPKPLYIERNSSSATRSAALALS